MRSCAIYKFEDNWWKDLQNNQKDSEDILKNDEHYNKALEKAAICQSPKILHNLFAMMLQTTLCPLQEELWMKEFHSRRIMDKEWRYFAENMQQQQNMV